MIDALLSKLGDGPVPAICATVILLALIAARVFERRAKVRSRAPALAPADQSGPHPRQSSPSLAPVSSRRQRIVLIVEDEPAAARAVARILRADLPTVDVETVTTSIEALERIRTTWVDLLIVDLGLPGMGGAELVRQVRESSLHPLAPVVIVSGKEPAVVDDVAREAGANAWLSKPPDAAKLSETVARLLGVSVER